MRNHVIASILLLLAVAGVVLSRAARADDDKPKQIDRGTLVVHALTADGAPIAGGVAEAWLVPAPTQETWGISATEPTLFVYAATDASGVAKIVVEEPAVWRVSVRAPGRATESRTVRVGLGVVRDETFHLAPGFALEGTVVDQTGKGTGGVTIYAGRVGWEGDLANFLAKATSDAAGRYRLEGLARGEVDVFARRSGAVSRWQARLAIPGNARLDFAFPRGGRMTGVVRDVADGARIAGARVRAYEFGGACVGECVADANGVYVLDASAPQVEIDEVVVDTPGRVLVSDASGSAAPGSGRLATGDTTECDLLVRRSARVIGTVTGGGRPVAGATVTLVSKSDAVASAWVTRGTTTDAAGAYAFDGVDAGQAIVRATAPGWRHAGFQRGRAVADRELADSAPPTARANVPATGAAEIDVALEPFAGRTITGRVLDDAKAPVGGADVECEGATTTTARDGTFRLDGVEPPEPDTRRAGDTSVWLQVHAPGLDDFGETLTLGEMAPGDATSTEKALLDGVEVVLHEFPRFRVRVGGDDGKPVPGATVTLGEGVLSENGTTRQWPPPMQPVADTTGPDGAVVVVYRGFNGEADVTVRAAGFATSRTTIQLEGGAREASADVKLVKGRDVVVKVVDGSTDKPVAGAWLTVGPDEEPHPEYVSAQTQPDERSAVHVGRTGADGTFRLRDVGPETIRVQALAAGHHTSEARITATTNEAVVVLGAHLSITGRIEFEDGRPAAGAWYSTFWVDHPEGWPCYFDGLTAAADGAFIVDRLRAGTYEIEVIAQPEDGRPEVAPCLAGPFKAGTSGVVIRLQTARRIDGTVVGSDGTGRVGASVGIAPRPDNRMAVAPVVTTGEGGRFVALGVARGPVHVRVVDESAEGGRARRVDVVGPLDPKDGEPVRIVLDDGLAISGTVVDGDGAPLVDAPIAVFPVGTKDPRWSEPDRACRSDAEGRFRIAGLAHGTYRVWFTDHDWRANAGSSGGGPGPQPAALDSENGTPAGTSGLALTLKR